MVFNTLKENLEYGDLERLIHPELHIDQYKSKMGDDADICVVSFKVSGKEPAADLVSFIEKGYDWVLDADVSSGEKEGGDYLVFIELDRSKNVPEEIFQLLNDILNLTEQKLSDWRVRFHNSTKDHELSLESLQKMITASPEAYRKKYEKNKDEENALDQLKADAGVEVKTKAPVNEFTEALRRAAGIA